MLTLRQVSRFLVNTLMVRPLRGPFVRHDGHCWIATLPGRTASSSRAAAAKGSTLVISENGVPLRPAHNCPDELMTKGRGLFADRGRQVLFATTDNSDPNTNERSYTYSLSPWLFRRRFRQWPSGPGNLQRRDTTAEQMKADVAHTISTTRFYLKEAQKHFPVLKGKRVLEVGPGINYGSVMLLACFGLRPMVVDRFLAPWEDAYHRQFYADLADELAGTCPEADTAPLRALVQAGGYDSHVVTRLQSPLEELPLADDSVDLVFSNAVVEHLYDLDSSFKQLYRITRPGGLGLHQVDFRDHRNFDRPLEYLLLEEEEFQSVFAECFGECANRYRPGEIQACIEAAGFQVLGFRCNMESKPDYVAELIPRLQAACLSRYCGLQAEDLRVLGGLYQLRKPA